MPPPAAWGGSGQTISTARGRRFDRAHGGFGQPPKFLHTMDRRGHENDRAFYCEAWNGTGAYTYDRIGRGTLHIRAACLSVLGGIQPGPLERYLRANGASIPRTTLRYAIERFPEEQRRALLAATRTPSKPSAVLSGSRQARRILVMCSQQDS